MPNIRLLPFAAAGSTNMALDEAMLESACEHGVASLRFYTWSEPTVSLGYFQPSEGRTLPNLRGLPWVRRSTGGAAIVHHHELTYSFALPPGVEWKSQEPWICRFHKLLRSLLVERGVTADIVVCGEEQKLGEVVCFLHHTAGDLAINGAKVAGSAQRKMKGALLQHGSILLRRSEFAPDLPGIFDFAGKNLFTLNELAELLTTRFAAECCVKIEPGKWTAEELARVPEIELEKYANPEWNERR